MKYLRKLLITVGFVLAGALSIVTSTEESLAKGRTEIRTAYDLYECVKDMEKSSAGPSFENQMDDLWNAGFCVKYLRGIFGATRLYPDLACLPDIKNGQMILIFEGFSNRHPGLLDRTALEVLSMALSEAYGCQKSQH